MTSDDLAGWWELCWAWSVVHRDAFSEGSPSPSLVIVLLAFIFLSGGIGVASAISGAPRSAPRIPSKALRHE